MTLTPRRFARLAVLELEGRVNPGFMQPVAWAAGASPLTVTFADLNRDGHPDMVYTGPGATSVGIRLQNSDGTFANPFQVVTGSAVPQAAAVADVNRDGIPDLLVAGSDNKLYVATGTGAGGFNPALSFGVIAGTSGNFRDIGVADFNRDGIADVVMSGGGGNNLALFTGTGTAALFPATAATVSVGGTQTGLVVGDLNRDGNPDVATLVNSTLVVARGTGLGLNPGDSGIVLPAGAGYLVAGDFNSDGRADVAVASTGQVTVEQNSTVGNSGPVSFQAGPILPVNGITGLAVGDVNHDSKLDLAVTLSGVDLARVFVNGGSGTFVQGTHDLTGASGPQGVVVTDVNGDGQADVAVAASTGGTVSIFSNDAGPAGIRSYTTTTTAQNNTYYLYQGIVTDLTGDGRPDFLQTTDPASNNPGLVLYQGQGNGTFATGSPITATGNGWATQVVVADLNRDGIPDLVFENSPGLAFVLGTGGGAFGSFTQFYTASFSSNSSLLAGDFDGDGRTDLALLSYGNPGSVTIFRNTTTTGSVSLVAQAPIAVAQYPTHGDVGDIDRDGRTDIVISTYYQTLDVLRNTSTGPGSISFAVNPVPVTATNYLQDVKLGDMNSDGILDMVVPLPGDPGSAATVHQQVAIFIGNGSGGFGSAQMTNTSGTGPIRVALADLNGDGRLDIVTVDNGASGAPANSLSVLLNTTPAGLGTVTFNNNQSTTIQSSSFGLGLSDFDGNGLPDALTISGNSSGTDKYTVTKTNLVGADTINVSGPANAQVGVAFLVNVSAALLAGGVDPRNGDTIHITLDETTDPQPADVHFQPGDLGELSTYLTLSVTGTRVITFHDQTTGANGTLVVNLGPGPAQTLAFGSTITAAAGAPVATFTLTARDQFNNVATDYRGTVHFTSTDGNATLPADYTFTAADSGSHTFTNAATFRTSGNQTLFVNDTGGPSPSGSDTVTVSPGVAAGLAFGQQPPVAATAGAAFSPAVTVRIVDQFGNTTNSTATVVMSLSGDPTGDVLGGTTNRAAVNGVASFIDLTLTKASAGYVLTATVAGFNVASNSFSVVAAATSKVSFIQQPTTVTAGVAIAPAVTVQLTDAFGNPTAGTNSITVGLTTPNGATLGGTTTQNAVAGLATFGDLNVNKAAAYTLTATGAGLTASVSGSFTVSAAAAVGLAYAQAPSGVVAGAAFSPAVAVRFVDAYGNTVTGRTDNVTVALGADPTGDTLGGSLSVSAVGGVATFNNLTLSKAGPGYTLTATSGGFTVESGQFTVAAAAAAGLAFGQQPGTATAGTAFSPSVTVRIVDAYGNTTTRTDGLTVALGQDPTGDTLLGTLTNSAVAGVATFGNLQLVLAGAGYTLTVTGAGFNATSNAFNVVAAAPALVKFVQQPTDATAGVAISPAVTVRVSDSYGNPTGGTNSITVGLTTPNGATLGGTVTQSAVGGVVTFGDLTVTKSGGYTLTATSAGLASGVSGSFAINPAGVVGLAFAQAPGGAVAGVAFSPAVTVRFVDNFGNTVTSRTDVVAMALGVNPTGDTLAGTLSKAAVGGIATFNDLKLTKAGSGYTLAASSGAFNVSSDTFTISPAAAAGLAFGQQPGTATAGAAFSPSVTVRIVDAFGNTTTRTDSLTIGLGLDPTGDTLQGTFNVAAAGGVATYSDLKLVKAGVGYTLVASGAGFNVTSAPFGVVAAAATRVKFVQQPTATTAGTVITPAITAQITDAFDNPTGGTTAVTVALGANPGSDTLQGTLAVNGNGGQAVFGDLILVKAAAGYTLTASAPNLTGATSAAFAITHAAAAGLTFVQQPTNFVAGTTIAPAVAVQVVDAFGNPAGGTNAVSLALSTNPTNDTLLGTKTQTASAGVATFGDLSLKKAATGYVLTATAGGLNPATSVTFTVTSAAAVGLSFAQQPGPATAGAAFSPAVSVRFVDAFGNAANRTDAVVVALTTNPTGDTLQGTLSVNAAAGVATYSDLKLVKAGTGYKVTATAGGFSATSSAFAVNAAAAAKLSFGTAPITSAAGPFPSAVTVRILDAFGNLASTHTDSVTLAFAANPGGGALGGTSTKAATAGVATFGDLTANGNGVGFTLKATAAGLTAVTSAPFNLVTLSHVMPVVVAPQIFGPHPIGSAMEAFVKGLYRTILARDAIPSEAAYYVNQINGGQATQKQVIANFWNSPENRTREVVNYYNIFLNRNPAQFEIDYYVQRLQAGTDETVIVSNFYHSPEENSAPNNVFVTRLYEGLLSREPSIAEVNYYVNLLNTGTTRDQVFGSFLHSPEPARVAVESDFLAYLQRPVTAAEENIYVPQITGGTQTFAGTAKAVLGLPEFFNDAAASVP